MFLLRHVLICGLGTFALGVGDRSTERQELSAAGSDNGAERRLQSPPDSKPPAPPSPSEPPTPPAPTGQPASEDKKSAPVSASPNERVLAILSALEKAGDDIKDIRCRVEYNEDNQVNLTTSKREGQILFLKAEPNPKFLVTFDRVEIDGRAAKDQKKTWFLFNGQVLFETREATKHVIEREVAKPGEKVDFFDLDKAPFPLPFGQKKDRILERFEVRLMESAPKDPLETDHLVCTPKPGTPMAEKYKTLDFYVRRDLNLPTRIRAVFADGDKTTIADFPDLSSRSINAGVKADDFNEPSSWKSYTRDKEKLDE